jgi:hypothetical protein
MDACRIEENKQKSIYFKLTNIHPIKPTTLAGSWMSVCFSSTSIRSLTVYIHQLRKVVKRISVEYKMKMKIRHFTTVKADAIIGHPLQGLSKDNLVIVDGL